MLSGVLKAYTIVIHIYSHKFYTLLIRVNYAIFFFRITKYIFFQLIIIIAVKYYVCRLLQFVF